MNINNDNDFGFSIVSEDELKEYEKQLQHQLLLQGATTKQKMEAIRDMVMPLLTNLKKDPTKQYIYWPNRVDKIDQFIAKINQFIEDNQ